MGMAARSSADAARSDMAASRAAASAAEAKTSVDFMRMDIEKLLIITEALWTMLKQANGYTDEQLIEVIQAIDMRDGKLDGKVARQPPPPCPKCNRTLCENRPYCLYCGAPVTRHPFDR